MSKQLVVLDTDGNVAEASIEDIIASEQNKFLGWTCETGVQSLYIDFDRQVWVGNCASGLGKFHLAQGKPAWGHLGTISEKFKLPKDNVVCPFDGCGCGSDIIVTKYNTVNLVKQLTTTDGSHWKTNKNFADLESLAAVKMRDLGKKQILWDIGRRCNYDCSYCWPNVHNTTDPHCTFAEFKNAADYLIDMWSDGNKIRWYFGGGEPTLNPDFEPFIEYLNSRNQWKMLVTNASQGPAYWAKNANNYDVLLFSAHFEFMKPELFIKNFGKVAETFLRDDAKLEKFIVKLMTPTGGINHSIEFVEKLKQSTPLYEKFSHRIQFDMVPLRGHQGYDRKSYDDSEVQKIIMFNKVNQ